jgi:phage terminase Nu1 subunit (DNA packaging protein)
MAELLTQSAVAEYLDVDARHVRRLEKSGLPVRTVAGDKRYPWPAALHWYIKHRETLVRGQNIPKRLAAAKVRQAEADATTKEMDLAKRQGVYVTVDDMERELETILRNLRAGLMTFAPRWAPELVGLETVGQVRAKLDEAIEELMLVLSRQGDVDAGSGGDAVADSPDDENDDPNEEALDQ